MMMDIHQNMVALLKYEFSEAALYKKASEMYLEALHNIQHLYRR